MACCANGKSAWSGILNGVDYDEWNTTRNPHLKHAYSFGRMAGKKADKLDLQREMGLPVNADVPLFGTITRLADQKGMDIELGALEEMLNSDIQFVLLGQRRRRTWSRRSAPWPVVFRTRLPCDWI